MSRQLKTSQKREAQACEAQLFIRDWGAGALPSFADLL